MCAGAHRRDKKGKKVRTKMNADSAQPAPELFALLDIIAVEEAAEKRTKLDLAESEDRTGAYGAAGDGSVGGVGI